MLARIFFLLITITSLFSTANCLENDQFSQSPNRLEALAAVLGNQDLSDLDLSLQRVYINPKNVTITDLGSIIYTSKNGKAIILPELFSSLEGCFIRCNENDLEALSRSEDLRMWWCQVCRRIRNMDKWGRCEVCGHPL